MGQLFYSMSIAMGIMITYGSYMKKDVNIESSVHQIRYCEHLTEIFCESSPKDLIFPENMCTIEW